MDKHAVISALERAWANEARWNGITRPYNAGDVYRLRGSIDIEYSLARYGAARLWELLREDRKSTRLNSSHSQISYAVFCLKKKKYHHATHSQPAICLQE